MQWMANLTITPTPGIGFWSIHDQNDSCFLSAVEVTWYYFKAGTYTVTTTKNCEEKVTKQSFIAC